MLIDFTVAKLQRGIDQQYVQLCLKLYLEGVGFRAIERVVGVSHVSVINHLTQHLPLSRIMPKR